MSEDRYAGDVTSKEAWEMLKNEPKAALVDVRTDAEWAYVGGPDLAGLGKDLVLVPWQDFPAMGLNPDFASQLEANGVERDSTLLFICRSGQRSRSAAVAMTARGFARCYNVGDGFEGPHDAAGHRGAVAGWKVAGLPWRQA